MAITKRSQPSYQKESHKRQRLDPKISTSTSTSTHTSAFKHKSQPKPSHRDPILINDLAWNSVKLPDQLEDAEGFYGLEEIENVAVVREEGGLEFRVGKLFSWPPVRLFCWDSRADDGGSAIADG